MPPLANGRSNNTEEVIATNLRPSSASFRTFENRFRLENEGKGKEKEEKGQGNILFPINPSVRFSHFTQRHISMDLK